MPTVQSPGRPESTVRQGVIAGRLPPISGKPENSGYAAIFG